MFYIKNVPNWERALRVVASAGVAAAALLWMSAPYSLVVAVSSAGFALTGLTGFCPMCAMVGRKLDNAARGG